MKRKYYLRGLGIGILITALVFSFVGPSEPTDEEIIKRAEELGYVKADAEDSSINIKDLMGTGTPAPTEKPATTMTPVPTEAPAVTITPIPTEASVPTPEATLTPTLTPTPVQTAAPTPTPSPTPEPTAVPTLTPTPEPTPQPTKAPEAEVVTAVIVVERGNSATIVCNKMEDAGIVEDGNEFRRYLVNHDLTDYINIGTYTLSSDMTFEEMAKLLTGR